MSRPLSRWPTSFVFSDSFDSVQRFLDLAAEQGARRHRRCAPLPRGHATSA